MRRIFTTGIIAVFLVGIVYFFFKVLVVDLITPLFRPLIVHLTDKEYLQIPLAIVLAIIVVAIVGSLLTRIRWQNLYHRYVRRVPQNLEKGRGALVSFGPDSYFLALIVKEITLQRINGKSEKYYVLYGPSSPLPWSGLPIIYVKKERVIPVKLSFGELYGISGSFGGTTPELLAELKSGGYIDNLAGEEGTVDSA